jgi:hypothetical protein
MENVNFIWEEGLKSSEMWLFIDAEFRSGIMKVSSDFIIKRQSVQ